MSIKPDYYKVIVEVRSYSGERMDVTLECNDLVVAKKKKNNLTLKQAWYFMSAIKYLFRVNNKGEAQTNIEKAITNLTELEYSLYKRS